MMGQGSLVLGGAGLIIVLIIHLIEHLAARG